MLNVNAETRCPGAAVRAAVPCDTPAEAVILCWIPRAPRLSGAMHLHRPGPPLPGELHSCFPPAGDWPSFTEAFRCCSSNVAGVLGQGSPTTAAAVAMLRLYGAVVHVFEQRTAVRAIPRGVQCSCQLSVSPAHLGCSRWPFTESRRPRCLHWRLELQYSLL